MPAQKAVQRIAGFAWPSETFSIDNGISSSDYLHHSRMLLNSEPQSISGQSSRIASFNYDAMGNRTSATIASQGGGTFNYGSATTANQYTSITGRSAITHDANGNQLLNGAGAAFTWDSENRLLTVTPVSPSLGDKAHVHSYDGLHRRVTRTTREWTSSGWTNLETTYFIYDGWNVIEEWTSTFSPATTATLTRRLTWGQDLAGSPSLQGAGGVGGLLMVEEITSTTNEAYHFHYDGNGNVTEITDHLGVSAATYRYDAFGNTLVATGTYAATNRYRFSTKPLDHEVTTAPLYYYGYRYLDPVTGRWPSRDPIEERGGVNLYGFVGNAPLSAVDLIGAFPVTEYEYPDSFNVPTIDDFRDSGGVTKYAMDFTITADGCCLSAVWYLLDDVVIRYNPKSPSGVLVIIRHERDHIEAINSRIKAIVKSMEAEQECYPSPEDAQVARDYFAMIYDAAKATALEDERNHDQGGGHGTPNPGPGEKQ